MYLFVYLSISYCICIKVIQSLILKRWIPITFFITNGEVTNFLLNSTTHDNKLFWMLRQNIEKSLTFLLNDPNVLYLSSILGIFSYDYMKIKIVRKWLNYASATTTKLVALSFQCFCLKYKWNRYTNKQTNRSNNRNFMTHKIFPEKIKGNLTLTEASRWRWSSLNNHFNKMQFVWTQSPANLCNG